MKMSSPASDTTHLPNHIKISTMPWRGQTYRIVTNTITGACKIDDDNPPQDLIDLFATPASRSPPAPSSPVGGTYGSSASKILAKTKPKNYDGSKSQDPLVWANSVNTFLSANNACNWVEAQAIIQSLMEGQALQWFQSLNVNSLVEFMDKFKAMFTDSSHASRLQRMRKQAEGDSIRSFVLDIQSNTRALHGLSVTDLQLKEAVYCRLLPWYEMKCYTWVTDPTISNDEFCRRLFDLERLYEYEKSNSYANRQPAARPSNLPLAQRMPFRHSTPLQPSVPQGQQPNNQQPQNQRPLNKFCQYCRMNNHNSNECMTNRAKLDRQARWSQPRQQVKAHSAQRAEASQAPAFYPPLATDYSPVEEPDVTPFDSADDQPTWAAENEANESDYEQVYSMDDLIEHLNVFQDKPLEQSFPVAKITNKRFSIAKVKVDLVLEANSLVDTGCTAPAILSENFLNKLIAKTKAEKGTFDSNTNVRLADNSITPPLKAVWILVSMGDSFAAVCCALILPASNFDLIIGVPLICAAKMKFDHSQMICEPTVMGHRIITDKPNDRMIFFSENVLTTSEDMAATYPGQIIAHIEDLAIDTSLSHEPYAVYKNDKFTVINNGTSQTVLSLNSCLVEPNAVVSLNKIRPFKTPYLSRPMRKIGLVASVCLDFTDPILNQIKINPKLDQAEVAKIKALILKYRDVFQKDEFDIGILSTKIATIDTGDAKPIRLKPYPLSPPHMNELRKILNRFKIAYVLVANTGGWAFPVFIQIKNGKPRMLCDIRKLNAIIKLLPCPLPNMKQIFRRLISSSKYTKIDMPDGYFQLPLDKESCEKAGIAVPDSQSLMYTRIPQGLSTAVSQFAEAIDILYSQISLDESTGQRKIEPYLDDALVHGKDIDEMLFFLEKVFAAHLSAGSKLNAKKIEIGYDEIEFLGILIGRDGVHPHPSKVEAIKRLRLPKTVKETRSYVGTINHLAPWIYNSTKLLMPFFELLKNNPSAQDEVKTSEVHAECHKEIVNYLSSNNLALAMFDETKQLYLETDASDYAIAAILLQEAEPKPVPVGYYAKKLAKYEVSLTTIEKEALAIVKACEFFETYIYASKFPLQVKTDCCGLCYIFAMKNMSHKVTRWSLQLSQYKLAVSHVKGSANVAADHLSRYLNFEPNSQQVTNVNEDEAAKTNHDRFFQFKQCLEAEKERLKLSFKDDPTLAKIAKRAEKSAFGDFVMQENILYKRIQCGLTNRFQLALCVARREKLVKELIWQLHDEAHLGKEKLYGLLKPHLYWPHMLDDLAHLVENCSACKLNKPNYHPARNVFSPVDCPSQINEEWELDYSGPYEESANGNKYLLVAMDRCSRFLVVLPTPDQTENNVIEFFKSRIFPIFGYPAAIRTDNGPCFKGKTLAEMMKKLHIAHYFSASYHSNDRPLVERIQLTVQLWLRTKTAETNRAEWENHLYPIVTLYNACKHATTNLSPYELQFAKTPSFNILPKNPAKEPQQMPKDPFELFGEIRAAANPKLDPIKSLAIKSFKPGDWVVIQTVKRSKSKLDPLFKGPYEVVHVWPNHNYTLSLVARKDSPKPSFTTVHADRIKKYVQPRNNSLNQEKEPPKTSESDPPNPPAVPLDPPEPGFQTNPLPPVQQPKPAEPKKLLKPSKRLTPSKIPLRKSTRVRNPPNRLGNTSR